ncbi:Plasmid stabilization element ParE%2C putative [Vibrio cholerae]|uniref:type II toxin-antitoxin system RelE/ParE family toxin n=1 Tax=Vibrio cholerae TaxID=666 RepID=UPI0006638DCE|nr:type II toxin-antitoxin system RelE/ParE family toxin [Vibrio cholerae]CSC96856.1 Plasmid stabilization element ParE%2C putative [Vibrio cholerae]
MKPFNLTVAAKADLRDIALFTQRRWGKEQRNVYLKQFDDSFWLLADSQQIRVIRILHKSMDVNPIFGA